MTAQPAEPLLIPLLNALSCLRHLARHLDPSTFAEHLDEAGAPEAPLRRALETGDAGTSGELVAAAQTTLLAFDGLRAALTAPDGLRQAFRSIRLLPRALAALYPLTQVEPAVSRFFLEPEHRENAALLARLHASPASPGQTGVIHLDNDRKSRGGVSIYVPEDYDPARRYPLVMALHGGAGHGSAFLWNWVTAARTLGAIVLAPTAIGDTWSLVGPDVDSENLARWLAHARQHWNLDPAHLLLTGMSDGGTFTLLNGMQEDSPFTHLAPFAASFHPMLVQFAEPARLAGLPIHLTHGALDWMFPVRVGRQAAQTLAGAGARVTYREIEDLSHVYPVEGSAPLLRWLMSDTTRTPSGQ